VSAALLAEGSIREAMEFVAAETGLIFPEARRGDFERGVRRTMARCKCRDAYELLDRCRGDKRLFDDLVAELAVYETYFFRDPAQFDMVRDLVLPELAARCGSEEPLTIWSAGCSTGEEPYSLAILLEQSGLSAQGRIHATDISGAALDTARKAIYGNWSFRGVPDGFAERYFLSKGDRHALENRFRDAVTFAQRNLLADDVTRPGGRERGFDLVFCRNVLIYFDAQTIARVANKLCDALDGGGWLVTAPSDPPLWDCAPFVTQMTDAGVLYRKAMPAAKRACTGTGVSVDVPRPAIKPSRPVRPRAMRAMMAPKSPVPASDADKDDVLAHARRALRKGRNAHVLASTEPLLFEQEACVLRLQALVNMGRVEGAERFSASAIARNPLSIELRYLRALVLFDLGRPKEAAACVESALYLDRDFVAGHMLLGAILKTCGDRAGAMRAYRNALAICRDMSDDDIVPLTDGACAGRLTEVAQAAVASLEIAEIAS